MSDLRATGLSPVVPGMQDLISSGIASGLKDISRNANPGEAEKAAKGFESILLHKLLGQMRQTVPESGLFHDGISKQLEGIFWYYLSEHLGSSGGLGLWKDIYHQFVNPPEPLGEGSVESLE